METEIWDYFEAQAPGKVVVAGPDIWNGSTAALQGFRNITGATFPLLLQAGTPTGGNVNLLYGDRDNYIVIDQQGIIRFNARQQGYVYGAALDIPRIRGLVDSLLLAATVGVPPGAAARGLELSAGPNPFAGTTVVSLAHAGRGGEPIVVEVFDASGRRVATLASGRAAGDASRWAWDASREAAGLYLVRARVGSEVATRRLVKVR